MTSRVAVVGGGLAGLACAGALRDAGFGVTVFDKGRGVGGRTSIRHDGDWRFDHGAPRLELGAPELVPCLVAMIAIDASCAIDELRASSGLLASAHRLDGRPGRTPSTGVELWVAHGSEAWSAARLEDDAQDAARELAAAMTKLVAGRVIHLRGHRWRYARAATRIAAPCAYDDALRIGVAGDGFAAGTSAPAASRALLSGLALAARIIAVNQDV